MKKSELKNIIRESIKSFMAEQLSSQPLNARHIKTKYITQWSNQNVSTSQIVGFPCFCGHSNSCGNQVCDSWKNDGIPCCDGGNGSTVHASWLHSITLNHQVPQVGDIFLMTTAANHGSHMIVTQVLPASTSSTVTSYNYHKTPCPTQTYDPATSCDTNTTSWNCINNTIHNIFTWNYSVDHAYQSPGAGKLGKSCVEHQGPGGTYATEAECLASGCQDPPPHASNDTKNTSPVEPSIPPVPPINPEINRMKTLAGLNKDISKNKIT